MKAEQHCSAESRYLHDMYISRGVDDVNHRERRAWVCGGALVGFGGRQQSLLMWQAPYQGGGKGEQNVFYSCTRGSSSGGYQRQDCLTLSK
jgi:hypothetical protein